MPSAPTDRIYLDHAATTPLDSDVRRAMANPTWDMWDDWSDEVRAVTD